MDKLGKVRYEKRLLLNCNILAVEDWLKKEAANGWILERLDGIQFQFKKTKPCHAEYLVLENFFTNEMKILETLRSEFLACKNVMSLGNVRTSVYTIYCVQINNADCSEIQEIRKKRNRFSKKIAWQMFALFFSLSIGAVVSAMIENNQFIELSISLSLAIPIAVYEALVLFHLRK